MLREIWTARETERRSLASDLHDGPAQALFHIAFRLQTARRQVSVDSAAALATLEQTEAAVRETLAQVRGIMSGLRPMTLNDLGLVSALKSECDAMAARGRVRVTVRLSGETRPLGEERETGLYRVTREALSNVERHAGTDRATLELDFGPDELMIRVSDRGRGLDPDAERAARRAGRMGLPTMRERVEALGGRMEIRSEPGAGVRITFHCPYGDGGTGRDNAGEQR